MPAPSQANEATPPSQADGQATPAAVWVLLGKHHGDNLQLLALAQALGRPFTTIQLTWRPHLSRLPGILLGRSLLPLAEPVDWPTPWPTLVLTAGRRAVPIVRWIQAQARRKRIKTRLIQLGRPRAPLRWFDLIITTAQYGLPADRTNIVGNLLPLRFTQDVDDAPLADTDALAPFASLPRPWTVALVGGNSRPYYFDADSARRLAGTLTRQVSVNGGSVIVLGSPRTREACLETIASTLEIPHVVRGWSPDHNPYGALLRHADRFVVTGDSLSMLGDALGSGKPVELFELPKRLDVRARIATFSRSLASRSRAIAALYAALMDAGLLFSLRDLAECHRRLRDAGMLAQPAHARAVIAQERSRALARIRMLLDETPPIADIPIDRLHNREFGHL